MDGVLEQKYEDAIWIGKSLFDRKQATGSSANMSFLHGGNIYITGSGTCFGRLDKNSFSVVTMEGKHISGMKPSKELPLHTTLYLKNSAIQAVIHTHSFYSTLWSCLEHENERDIIPNYTPYLRMKVGTIGLIPYGPPGSQELFDLFTERINWSDGFLLKNHGAVIGDKDLMSAFYGLEELEESAKTAWHSQYFPKNVKLIDW